MRRLTPGVMLLMAPVAMTLLMVLPGCAQGYGGYGGPAGYASPGGYGGPDAYGDPGSEWDGQLYVQGGQGGRGRDYHPQAFRAEGGRHPVAVGSDRGRASMGVRASGGGHAPSGGGEHAPSGGGRK
jgi:hypothetical protein